MKLLALAVLVLFLAADVAAQRQKTAQKQRSAVAGVVKYREIGHNAVVADETLSVLRTKPSLFAEVVQRMRLGRKVRILAVAEADGVRFFRVVAAPSTNGWVQADAVFGRFRPEDDERFANLIRAATGFEQIEAAKVFLEFYPDSPVTPSILLLFGDLVEDSASRLSRDATARLRRSEMAATAAPLHSYYLNFVSLDRYRRLGIQFLFNSATRQFHYDGASWQRIIERSPGSKEAAEARSRLDILKEKMEKTAAN